jgi:hypothetical protein
VCKLLKAYFFLLIPFFGFAGADSLKTERFLVVDFNLHGGKIVKNYNPLPVAQNTFISEIFVGTATNGTKSWHSHFFYPQVGISLFLADFGNQKILGRSISLMPGFIFKHGNLYGFSGELKLGGGVAFFNKHYDVIQNPENLYIGSVATLASSASYSIIKGVNSKLFLKAGVSFFHFSNGHYQLPNIGMNIPCFNIGIKYLPSHFPLKYIENRITEVDKRINYNARIGFGLHEMGYAAQSVGGTKYPVYTITLYASKRLASVNNVHIGIFTSFYTSIKDYIITQDVYSSEIEKKSTVTTIFLGHEFIAGHFGFVTQAGVNIYNPFRKKYMQLTNQKNNLENFMKIWSGNKFGIQYYPVKPEQNSKNKLFVGAYLKTNFDQADFVEFGLGFTF